MHIPISNTNTLANPSPPNPNYPNAPTRSLHQSSKHPPDSDTRPILLIRDQVIALVFVVVEVNVPRKFVSPRDALKGTHHAQYHKCNGKQEVE